MTPTEITSEAQYSNLLAAFCAKLCDSIPSSENPRTELVQADVASQMQYRGAVVVRLITKSSGVDNYLVYMDNNNHGQFVRVV